MSAYDFTVDNISSSEVTKTDVRNIPRPVSVKVTDYSYNHVNPSPVKIIRGCDLLEEFLSPRKLQALTGVDELETVEYLEMRVNTEQMSLGNFGMYLPNLSQIKLSGSYIPSIRDLGTSLWNIQVLWMPQCNLMCLDGLVTMSSLKELYLAYNQIDDISPCAMLENLEILDLEGNLLEDLTNIHYLSMCPVLCRLTLEGNPLCNPEKYSPPQTYRKSVLEIVPQLKFLDDLAPNFESKVAAGDSEIFQMELRDTSNATLEFEDHWNFINRVLVESGLLAESERARPSECAVDQSSRDSGRPSTTSLYTGSSRPGTSMRPMSASQRPPLSSGMVRPLSSSSSSANQRPDSGTTIDSGTSEADERAEDSVMTAGRIVCGNVTKSLRRRMTEESQRMEDDQDVVARISSGRRTTGGAAGRYQECNVEETCDIVLKELDEWRRDYERSKTRIEQQRAPQVLTIEYTEEDIEELDLANKVNVPKMEKRPDDQVKVPRKVKEMRPEIKLNPIRNGKLPSSWVPKDHQQQQQQRGKHTEPSLGPVNPPTVQSAPPQMSRIRRQLLESGVATMTPSRPPLKK